MLAAVVGGRLQGAEAAYLAKKVGWGVLVFDRDDQAPARGLGDAFFNLDLNQEKRFKEHLKGVDLIIPTLEDLDALSSLASIASALDIPLALDPAAYRISSSKTLSNEVFARLGLPLPRPWPQCGVPVLVKPDGQSGSAGVRVFANQEEITTYLGQARPQETLLIQEYLLGPSFSLEVMGTPGRYSALLITDLFMDQGHDCKRVTAPSELNAEQCAGFKEIGLAIAQEINLQGLMDVEVILHQGQLKVLEIDARLPSQTPSAVFWSTGFNMVKALGELFGGEWESALLPPSSRHVIYEHLKVTPDAIAVTGEHVMAQAGRLQVIPGFKGAEEAITDYQPGKTSWVATMIYTDATWDRVRAKRSRALQEICRATKIGTVRDESPRPGLVTP